MAYRRCTYCGKQDHPTSLCPKSYGGSSARMHLRCGYCGSNTHDKKFCLKTAGGSANRRVEPNGAFLD